MDLILTFNFDGPQVVPSRSRSALTTLVISVNCMKAYAEMAPCRLTSTSCTNKSKNMLQLNENCQVPACVFVE